MVRHKIGPCKVQISFFHTLKNFHILVKLALNYLATTTTEKYQKGANLTKKVEPGCIKDFKMDVLEY